LAEGHRRMHLLLLLGVTWATSQALTPVIGSLFSGAAATALFAGVAGIFALGECIHGTVQAPLVADLAVPAMIGRYMALSAFSWQVGFTISPAAGGFLLAAMPNGVWLLAGGLCLLAGFLSLSLEPSIPRDARRSPVRGEAFSGAAS